MPASFTVRRLGDESDLASIGDSISESIVDAAVATGEWRVDDTPLRRLAVVRTPMRVELFGHMRVIPGSYYRTAIIVFPKWKACLVLGHDYAMAVLNTDGDAGSDWLAMAIAHYFSSEEEVGNAYLANHVYEAGLAEGLRQGLTAVQDMTMRSRNGIRPEAGEFVEYLNQLVNVDQSAMEELIRARVRCNRLAAFGWVQPEIDSIGRQRVGLLGVVNGFFGGLAEGDLGGRGAVQAVSLPSGVLTGFRLAGSLVGPPVAEDDDEEDDEEDDEVIDAEAIEEDNPREAVRHR